MGYDMGKVNIFVEGWMHHKNKNGMDLMNCELLEFQNHLNKDTNWILNLSDFKDYGSDDFGLIFGPQIMFPAIDDRKIPKHRRYTCNVLSEWVVNLCKDINPDVNFTNLPFAIDVNRFIPSEKNGRPVIYFKYRDRSILNNVLEKLGNNFDIYEYEKGYSETEFLKSISRAPYLIWIGCQESQGFAFQETLSCDTPIFVINVRSLREEHRSNSFWTNYLPNHKLPATSASYFDDTCGMLVYPENWENNWESFLKSLEKYNPRDFIIKNLSPNACVDRWIKTLNEI